VRAIDRLDWELLRACYHPDAVEDRGRFRGDVDGLIDWLREVLAGFEWTWHLLGIPSVEFDDDVAWVETYCLAVQQPLRRDTEEAPDARMIPLRYCDRFERRNGTWGIAKRVAVYEPGFILRGDSMKAALGAVSRRNRGDMAYVRDL
jgi:hypothetical protein